MQGVEGVANWLKESTPAIQEWVSALVDVGQQIGDAVMPYLKDLASVGVAAFTALEVYGSNWEDTMRYAFTAVGYEAVKAFNVLSYYLTDLVPGYLKWFGDNWGKILTDVMNYAGTVFGNMGANIKAFFEAFWGWLKGDEFDFQWTSLSKGFEATLKELPQIADREIGPVEEALGRRMDELGNKLGGDFQGKLKERLAEFGLVDGVDSGIGAGGGGGGVDMTPHPAPYAGGGGGKEKSKDKAGKSGGAAPAFEDLGSLYKRIAGSAATRDMTPEEKKAKADREFDREMLAEAKKGNALAQEMASVLGYVVTNTRRPMNTGTPGWATEEM
jgi:hypothetical protein